MGFNVGENIKKYRKLKGLTQKELADKLGIKQQSVAQYERTGRLPKLATILYIADALDVPLSNLLYGDSNNISNKAIQEVEKWTNDMAKRSLIANFNKLNTLGREKALERVEELTLIEQYIDKDTPLPETESETDEQ